MFTQLRLFICGKTNYVCFDFCCCCCCILVSLIVIQQLVEKHCVFKCIYWVLVSLFVIQQLVVKLTNVYFDLFIEYLLV